ncbi:hypothetical protein JCM11491_002365 [Sporobolomyces phaffii]
MSLSGYPPILDDVDLLPSWSRDPSPPDSQRRHRTASGTFLDHSTFQDDPLEPLSFSNVASLQSLSPKVAPTTPLESPPAALSATDSQRVGLSEPQGQPAAEDFAADLTEGLQRRETAGAESEVANDGRIQAFAKLEFDHFDIYIQKLSVVIGRRPVSTWTRKASLASQDSYKPPEPSNKTPPIKQEDTPASGFPFSASPVASAQQPSNKGKEKAVDESFSEFIKTSPPLVAASIAANQIIPELSLSESVDPLPPVASTSKLAAPAPELVPVPIVSTTDIDLGFRRAISRQHARLYYDHEVGGWILEVLGRNGVVIEGHWRAKGQKTLLLEKTKIQIADRIFHFLLPTIDVYRAGGEGPVKSEEPSKSSGAKKGGKSGAAKGKGKGKGKGKTRIKVDEGADSSSLSEVSDSELDHSPLPLAPTDLAPIPKPDESTSTVKPSPSPIDPALSPSILSANPSLPPLPARSSSLPTSTSAGGSRPSRSPLPRQASLRAHNPMAPPQRAASRNAVYTESQIATSPRPVVQPVLPPTAEELEMGRQRAAAIAQLLAGPVPGVGGKSPTVVTQATSRRPGTRSGKGKATASASLPPPPGKGPGKGKAPPPRPIREWGDEDDSDDSDDDSDDEDVEMAEVEASLVRKTPVKGLSSRAPSPAPDVAPPSLPPPDPSPVSVAHPGMATKQPKRRASSQTVAASPAPPPGSNLPSTSLPPLPTSHGSLPLLPSAPSSAPLPPSTTPFEVKPDISQSPSSVPPAGPPRTLSASTTALPLAPASAYGPPMSSTQPVAPASKTTKKSKSKAAKASGELAPKKKKSASKATSGAPDPSAPTLNADGEPVDPRKPRPTPYAPAPHPAGVPLPIRAPADDPLAKPPYTYASLIAQALATTDSGKMTMAEIYGFITTRWPYFKDHQSGWQNSIRHNLVPARGFLKVLRRDDEVGKGAFWMMDPAQTVNFDGFHFRRPPAPNSKNASSAATGKSASPAKEKASTPIASATPSTSAPTSAKTVSSKSTKSTKSKTPAPATTPVPAPSSSSSASTPGPSTTGNAALSKPLPIVVGPIPDSYVRPAPPKPAANTSHDEVTAALLADPPIVLHEGKIILNPGIFAHLTKEQLDNFQAIPASKALQILQAFVVQYFKDKMRRAAAEKARAAKVAAAGGSGLSNGAAGISGTSGTTTNGTDSFGTNLSSAAAAAVALSTSSESILPGLPVSTAMAASNKKREREPEPDLVVSDSEPLSKYSRT